MYLDPVPSIVLFVSLIVGIIVMTYELQESGRAQYRPGCRECAESKRQVEIAEKRRQEQLQREWLEDSRRLYGPGADARVKRIVRRADDWMVSAKEVIEEVSEQVSADEARPNDDDGGRSA